MADSLKREFRIDSSDSAKPPVTMQDEPRYFSNIAPKKRHVIDVIYEDTGEVSKTRTGKPVKIILKTTVYNDGCFTEQTVGEDNEAYKNFLATGQSIPSQNPNPPRERPLSDKVKAALSKANKADAAAKKKAPAKKED